MAITPRFREGAWYTRLYKRAYGTDREWLQLIRGFASPVCRDDETKAEYDTRREIAHAEYRAQLLAVPNEQPFVRDGRHVSICSTFWKIVAAVFIYLPFVVGGRVMMAPFVACGRAIMSMAFRVVSGVEHWAERHTKIMTWVPAVALVSFLGSVMCLWYLDHRAWTEKMHEWSLDYSTWTEAVAPSRAVIKSPPFRSASQVVPLPVARPAPRELDAEELAFIDEVRVHALVVLHRAVLEFFEELELPRSRRLALLGSAAWDHHATYQDRRLQYALRSLRFGALDKVVESALQRRTLVSMGVFDDLGWHLDARRRSWIDGNQAGLFASVYPKAHAWAIATLHDVMLADELAQAGEYNSAITSSAWVIARSERERLFAELDALQAHPVVVARMIRSVQASRTIWPQSVDVRGELEERYAGAIASTQHLFDWFGPRGYLRTAVTWLKVLLIAFVIGVVIRSRRRIAESGVARTLRLAWRKLQDVSRVILVASWDVAHLFGVYLSAVKHRVCPFVEWTNGNDEEASRST
jgi:hypothetical protein